MSIKLIVVLLAVLLSSCDLAKAAQLYKAVFTTTRLAVDKEPAKAGLSVSKSTGTARND